MRLEEGEGEEAAHAEADEVDDEAPLHAVARAQVVVALRALVTPLLRLTWLGLGRGLGLGSGFGVGSGLGWVKVNLQVDSGTLPLALERTPVARHLP